LRREVGFRHLTTCLDNKRMLGPLTSRRCSGRSQSLEDRPRTSRVRCSSQCHESRSLLSLGTTGSLSSLLDVLSGLRRTSGTVLLSALLLLLLLDLSLTLLDFLGSGVSVLVARLTGLGLSSLDLIKGHTDDGLLDAGGLARSLSHNIVNLDLLVECSPGEGPGELDWLDFLVEHLASLVANEVVSFSILGDETTAAAWEDFEFCI